jgi:ribosomal protein L39E
MGRKQTLRLSVRNGWKADTHCLNQPLRPHLGGRAAKQPREAPIHVALVAETRVRRHLTERQFSRSKHFDCSLNLIPPDGVLYALARR